MKKILIPLLFSIFILMPIISASWTYDNGTPKLTIQNEGNITLEDIYQQDVSNGWNHFYRLYEGVYNTTMQIVFVNTYLNTDNELFIINHTVNNMLDFTGTKQRLNATNTTFYFIGLPSQNNIRTSNTEIYINGCTFDNIPSNDRFFLIGTGCSGYINDTIFNNVTFQARSNIIYRNVFTLGSHQGFSSYGFDCTINDILSMYGDVGFKYHANAYDVTLIDCTFFDNGYDIYYQEDENYNLTLIDCDFGNTLTINWAGVGAGNGEVYINNTFNLITEPNSNIRLYNSTGVLILDLTSNATGRITEQNIEVMRYIYSNPIETRIYNTPFRLIINKSGYIEYNETFNNSFKPINYQIGLTLGEIRSVITTEVGLTIQVTTMIMGLVLLGFSIFKQDAIFGILTGVVATLIFMLPVLENFEITHLNLVYFFLVIASAGVVVYRVYLGITESDYILNRANIE